MDLWQIVLVVLLALLPLLLLVVFHPHGERLSGRGTPISRSWPFPPRQPEGDDDQH